MFHVKQNKNMENKSQKHNTEVEAVLETCRQNRTRIRIDYGDVKTGRSWNETHDVTGYVGRSTGTNPIPLLVYNSRSLGGGAIMLGNILSIKTSKGGRVLYQAQIAEPETDTGSELK